MPRGWAEALRGGARPLGAASRPRRQVHVWCLRPVVNRKRAGWQGGAGTGHRAWARRQEGAWVCRHTPLGPSSRGAVVVILLESLLLAVVVVAAAAQEAQPGHSGEGWSVTRHWGMRVLLWVDWRCFCRSERAGCAAICTTNRLSHHAKRHTTQGHHR